jgi:hypothetical protein
MPTKKPKIEYQHFDLEHRGTGEKLSLKIGPIPIHMEDFGKLMNKAYKEKGKKFTKSWLINKAWVGE